MASGNNILVDLQDLYQRNFGSRPKVGALSPIESNEPRFELPAATLPGSIAQDGSTLYTMLHGVEIWLPTKLRGLSTGDFEGGVWDIPYSVISIRAQADWIETPMQQRKGSAKELYSTGDYDIAIKGFFIDRQRVWPYDDLLSLRKVFEAGKPFQLDNALSNIFLSNDQQAVMKSFELYPVEAKSQHVRPFAIQLESDSIFTLEYA